MKHIILLVIIFILNQNVLCQHSKSKLEFGSFGGGWNLNNKGGIFDFSVVRYYGFPVGYGAQFNYINSTENKLSVRMASVKAVYPIYGIEKSEIITGKNGMALLSFRDVFTICL